MFEGATALWVLLLSYPWPRTTDRAGDRYHHARPDHSEELIDHLVGVTELRKGDRLLEIGCGTGKAVGSPKISR